MVVYRVGVDAIENEETGGDGHDNNDGGWPAEGKRKGVDGLDEEVEG